MVGSPKSGCARFSGCLPGSEPEKRAARFSGCLLGFEPEKRAHAAGFFLFGCKGEFRSCGISCEEFKSRWVCHRIFVGVGMHVGVGIHVVVRLSFPVVVATTLGFPESWLRV